MVKVEYYKTLDGAIHANKDIADRHLDVLYGNIICKLANEICNTANGKYTKTIQCIEANLDKFQKLLEIKADFEIAQED